MYGSTKDIQLSITKIGEIIIEGPNYEGLTVMVKRVIHCNYCEKYSLCLKTMQEHLLNVHSTARGKLYLNQLFQFPFLDLEYHQHKLSFTQTVVKPSMKQVPLTSNQSSDTNHKIDVGVVPITLPSNAAESEDDRNPTDPGDHQCAVCCRTFDTMQQFEDHIHTCRPLPSAGNTAKYNDNG
jgi:hypothetical protein